MHSESVATFMKAVENFAATYAAEMNRRGTEFAKQVNEALKPKSA